jgi:hypothetical protein
MTGCPRAKSLAKSRSTHIEREFPDEERMESLASRVRRLTLAEMPIRHRKVMNAIDRLIRVDGATPGADHLAREGTAATLAGTQLGQGLPSGLLEFPGNGRRFRDGRGG